MAPTHATRTRSHGSPLRAKAFRAAIVLGALLFALSQLSARAEPPPGAACPRCILADGSLIGSTAEMPTLDVAWHGEIEHRLSDKDNGARIEAVRAN